MVKNIAILASGNGSNAENICNFFAKISDVNVVLIGTNNQNAFVINRAKKLKVPHFVFTKDTLNTFTDVHKILSENDVDFVVLAGFLLKVPKKMVQMYLGKIINIHPALLPRFGGKGMYGKYVHKAVIKDKEKESGITIHFVNNKYDAGEIVFQTKCSVEENDCATTLAEKVHALEMKYYPKIIADIIKKTEKW
jgi:phosphoribosylglycinamide formyltransferase-1